jgi:OOP family OmpA-OmpF porin
MRNSDKLRVVGLLALTLSAPAAMSIQQPELLWQAQPMTDAWVSSSGECWASQCKKTTGLAPCGAKVVVPAEITVRLNFNFDKYGLNDIVNDAELARLEEYIAQVKATPEQEAITIIGHTDAKGSDEYNMALGQRRANTMRDFMVSKGVPANLISTESMGKREMLPDHDIFSVYQRRATIRTTVPAAPAAQ